MDDINNSELTQKEIDYLVEFVENGNSKNWEKAKKDLHSDMHRDSIRKSWYVGKYSGYNVYKYMQDNGICGNATVAALLIRFVRKF